MREHSTRNHKYLRALQVKLSYQIFVFLFLKFKCLHTPKTLFTLQVISNPVRVWELRPLQKFACSIFFSFNLVPYGVFIGCQDMDVCKKFASTACMVSWVRETCKSKCSACGYGKFLQETLKNAWKLIKQPNRFFAGRSHKRREQVNYTQVVRVACPPSRSRARLSYSLVCLARKWGTTRSLAPLLYLFYYERW